MKLLTRFSAAVLSACAMCTLLAQPALAQEKITIYSAAPQDLLDQVIPAFEKASRIKVDVIKGGSGDLINRLRAEAGVATMAVGLIVHARQAEAILLTLLVTFLYGKVNKRLNRHLPSNLRSRIRLRPQLIR